MAGKKQMRKRDQLYRYLHSPRPGHCTCYALTIHITRSRPPRVCVCVCGCVSAVNQQATVVPKRSSAKISGEL